MKKCLICNSPIEPFISFEKMPIANGFLSPEEFDSEYFFELEVGFCIAIGNPHGRVRVQLHDKLQQEGLQPVTLAHPTASIADNATIGPGSQILAGAIVAPEAKLGRECIINTNASVVHECVLEDGVEVAPGAILCGLVKVDTNGWIWCWGYNFSEDQNWS